MFLLHFLRNVVTQGTFWNPGRSPTSLVRLVTLVAFLTLCVHIGTAAGLRLIEVYYVLIATMIGSFLFAHVQ